MSEAMQVANIIHNSGGLSDGAIGELVGVSREYINAIRNGRKVASSVLTEKLAGLLDTLAEGDIPQVHSTIPGVSKRVQGAAVEDTYEGEYLTVKQLLWGAGILIAVLVLIVFIALKTRSVNRRKQQEDD